MIQLTNLCNIFSTWILFKKIGLRNGLKLLISLLGLIILIFCLNASEEFLLKRQEIDFSRFSYPMDIPNFGHVVANYTLGQPVNYSPLNVLENIITLSKDMKTTDNCRGPVDVLILVRSRVTNALERDLIRRTWGHASYLKSIFYSYSNIVVKVLFIVGVHKDLSDSTRRLLRAEIAFHNDLIIGEFLDVYKNLLFKTLTGMRWAKENCPQFSYLLFVDDDMYLSVLNLVTFLKDPFRYPTSKIRKSSSNKKFFVSGKSHNFYAGTVFARYSPYRRNMGLSGEKSFLSLSEYPFNQYPSYVSLGALILSHKTLVTFYYASAYVKFVKIDDVYLGIIAYKLGIKPFNVSDFIDCCGSYNKDCPTDPTKPNFKKTAIAMHNIQPPNRRFQLWFHLHFPDYPQTNF